MTVMLLLFDELNTSNNNKNLMNWSSTPSLQTSNCCYNLHPDCYCSFKSCALLCSGNLLSSFLTFDDDVSEDSFEDQLVSEPHPVELD